MYRCQLLPTKVGSLYPLPMFHGKCEAIPTGCDKFMEIYEKDVNKKYMENYKKYQEGLYEGFNNLDKANQFIDELQKRYPFWNIEIRDIGHNKILKIPLPDNENEKFRYGIYVFFKND